MEQLKFYEKYKESGVAWLGDVPEHWGVMRLGSQFMERKEKVSDKDFAPLSVTKKGILPQLETAAKTNDGDNRKKVVEGDFVINSRSDRKGSSGVSPYTGSVSLINTVLKPILMYPGYIHNFFRNHSFQEEFYRVGRGIHADLWSTKYSDMASIMMPVPPLPEQQQIARYLDWQSAKINKFIKNKKKLIALLKEQKQNIINEAVTKGIDPNVKMKDSGVEWLGEIPEHWEVRKLKHCVSNLNQQTDTCENDEIYLALENIESWNGKINIPTDKVAFDSKVKKYNAGDILFGKLRPYLAKVALPEFKGVCVGEFLVLRINELVNPQFLAMLLRSKKIIDLITSSTYGAKMPRADWGFIGSVFIGIPPIKEQLTIFSSINQETALIDETILKAEKEITLIQEYRTRLVSDVVTGKLDVRSIEIPDFETIVEDVDLSEDDEDSEDVEDLAGDEE